MKILASLKQRAGQLKTEAYSLYLASRDPRVPWYAKVFLAILVAYILSPVDLIPDFIPVLGYIDDLLIVPAGVFLALKMIPREVMVECRNRATVESVSLRAKWFAAGIIILLWLVAAYFLFRLIRRMFFS